MDLNCVALVGRLGKDPESRATTNNTVADFSIAVDEGFGDKKSTSWINIKAWGKTAEFAISYLRKGNLVSVTGRLKQETWETKEGQKRDRVVVIAESLQGLTPKGEQAQRPAQEPQQAESGSDDDGVERDANGDELPF